MTRNTNPTGSLAMTTVANTIDDYAPVALVTNDVWPDNQYTAAELLDMDDTHFRAHPFGRWLATLNGEPVGQAKAALVHWQAVENKFMLEVEVRPAFQRRGIGARLYRQALDFIAPLEPQQLLVYTREDKPRAIGCLERLGYAQTQRDARSRLDLTRFEAAPFTAHAARAAAAGITIVTLSDYQAQTELWLTRLHAFHNEIRLDVPATAPPEPIPLDMYARRFDGPAHDPDLFFIALDGTTVAGYSFLELSGNEPHKLYTGFTGVRRAYRRRGVATALKLRGLQVARARSVTVIETDNEENNPMYGLNMALGFEPAPAWLAYELTLTDQAIASRTGAAERAAAEPRNQT